MRRFSIEIPNWREILLNVSPFWIFTHAGWVGVVGAGVAGAGVEVGVEAGRRSRSPEWRRRGFTEGFALERASVVRPCSFAIW